MRLNTLVIAAGSLFLFAAPLLAQHDHGQSLPAPVRKQPRIIPAAKPPARQPVPEAGAMDHCMTMTVFTPASVLKHRDPLGVTADQVRRLEALEQEITVSVGPHMRAAMTSHAAAADLIRGETTDLAVVETKLREAGDHMVAAHLGMARVNLETRRLLSQQQKDKLATIGAAADSGMSCPMMGQTHGNGGEHKH